MQHTAQGNSRNTQHITPTARTHEVREPVGVRRAVELADVHDVVLVAQHGALVVVRVEVVGRAEQRDDRGEALGALAVPAPAKTLINLHTARVSMLVCVRCMRCVLSSTPPCCVFEYGLCATQQNM